MLSLNEIMFKEMQRKEKMNNFIKNSVFEKKKELNYNIMDKPIKKEYFPKEIKPLPIKFPSYSQINPPIPKIVTTGTVGSNFINAGPYDPIPKPLPAFKPIEPVIIMPPQPIYGR